MPSLIRLSARGRSSRPKGSAGADATRSVTTVVVRICLAIKRDHRRRIGGDQGIVRARQGGAADRQFQFELQTGMGSRQRNAELRRLAPFSQGSGGGSKIRSSTQREQFDRLGHRAYGDNRAGLLGSSSIGWTYSSEP